MTIPSISRSSDRAGGGLSRVGRHFSSLPFQAIARILLIATIFAAPWVFGAVEPWAWGKLMVLALITLVLWAAGCAYRGVLKISWSPLYGPFLAFLILAAVQLFTGSNADHVATREAVLKIAINLIFFFLA